MFSDLYAISDLTISHPRGLRQNTLNLPILLNFTLTNTGPSEIFPPLVGELPVTFGVSLSTDPKLDTVPQHMNDFSVADPKDRSLTIKELPEGERLL